MRTAVFFFTVHRLSPRARDFLMCESLFKIPSIFFQRTIPLSNHGVFVHEWDVPQEDEVVVEAGVIKEVRYCYY